MRSILFYCHFRHSLGHYARTRLIAQQVADLGAKVTLLFGGRRPPGLVLDPRFSVLDLPEADDRDAQTSDARGPIIRQAIDELKPDRVLVDYMALGLGAELMEALLHCSPSIEFVWGMPYPGGKRGAPRNPRLRKAIARYAMALVYTDGGFLDPVETFEAYGVPDRLHRVGVVTNTPVVTEPTDPPLVVGLAGSGLGADVVISLLLQVAAPLAQAGKICLRLVAGVYHDSAEEIAKARALPWVEVLESGSAEASSQDATVVVARCGYNSAFAVANTDLSVVFIPRPNPDPAYTEQTDRAKALAELDGIWWVDEQDPEAAGALSLALIQALKRGRKPRSLPFTTDGARNAARILMSPSPVAL